MTEKEKVFEYMKNPVTTNARNRMGCNENWYNPYYAITETFDEEEISRMSDIEIEHLVELAGFIAEALY